jgi:hypothetical protein
MGSSRLIKRKFQEGGRAPVRSTRVPSGTKISTLLNQVRDNHDVIGKKGPPAITKDAQLRLQREGYYDGEIDGIYGPKTREADRNAYRLEAAKRHMERNARYRKEGESLPVPVSSPLIRYRKSGGLMYGHGGYMVEEHGLNPAIASNAILTNEDVQKAAAEKQKDGQDASVAMNKARQSAEQEKRLIEKIQVSNGNKVDGIWGSETQAGYVEIKKLQQALSNVGMYAGKPDGIFGPKTREALAKAKADESTKDMFKSNPDTIIIEDSVKPRLIQRAMYSREERNVGENPERGVVNK